MKNINLYMRIVGTVIISLFIAQFILMAVTTFSFLYIIYITILFVIPTLIIGFVIFYFIQNSSYARFINKRNISILCILLAVIILASTTYFTAEKLPPSELRYNWNCDGGQILCDKDSNCAKLLLFYDYTYGRNVGNFIYRFVNSSKTMYGFEWDFERDSNKLRLFESSFDGLEWEITLRIEFIDTRKIITHFISEQNAPFDAELLDGLSWSA